MSLPMAILLLVGALCMWIPDFKSQEAPIAVLTLILGILNADILMYLCQRTAMTRSLSWIPVLMYLLPFGVGFLSFNWQSQVGVFCMLISILMLVKAFHMNNAVEEAFLGTLFIIVGSYFLPSVLLLLPLFIMGFVMQRAFNVKIISASLIALAIFGIFYVTINKLTGWVWSWNWSEFLSYIWQGFSLKMWFIYLLGIIGIYFIISNYFYYQRENATVQSLLNILIIPFALALIIQSLPILIVTLSGISAHYFSTRESMTRGIVFFVYILICITCRVLLTYNILL